MWNGKMLILNSALILRLILAFEMEEASGPDARKPNIDILNFSDVHNSLVARPRMFDCHYTARDPNWLAAIMSK
jgi:phenylacetate 2-hydroxylase